MATYSENDWRNYSDDSLEHGWGHSPEQKKREREYNHEYWLENKERLLKKRHAGRYLTNTGQSKEGWEFLDGSTYSYRKPSGDPSGAGDQYLTAHGRSSNFERRYGEANRQARIHSEVSALKNQNAANYRQSQIDSEVSSLKNANASRYAASQAVAKRGYQDSQAGASEGRYTDSGTGNARAGASAGRYAAASGTRSQVVKPGSASSGGASDSGTGTRAVVAQAKKRVNQIAQRAIEIGQKALDRVIKLQQNKR